MNRHGVDGDVLHGTVPRTRGGIGNRIDDSQLTGHFAKDGVFAVEELCRLVGNEELAAIGIRTCIGHGELSGTIMATMRETLIFELVSWIAPTRSFGAAALNHEARNHAVKDQAIVKTLGSQIQETGAGNGSVACKKRDIDGALGSVESDLDVIHGSLLGRKLEDSSSTGKVSQKRGHGWQAFQDLRRSVSRGPEAGDGEGVIAGSQTFPGRITDEFMVEIEGFRITKKILKNPVYMG